MQYHEIETDADMPIVFDARRNLRHARNIVLDEAEWRSVPQASDPECLEGRVIPTRWHAVKQGTHEAYAETAGDCHIVKIVLRNMNMRLSVAGRTVQDGVVTPGMVHVSEPATSVHCHFRGPYDVLHLHVPNDLIAECARDMPGRQVAALRSAAPPANDLAVERLGRALLDADQVGGSFGQLYADSVSVAIVARLLASAGKASDQERPRVAELARWRLKRAIDYVDAHLDEPVRLADVAAAAGLTRMHFAAQFRAATQQSPHEFLLRRRIERAQEMLAETTMSVVDIALSVGFQTQAHFTSVFKRFAGRPPQTWRRAYGDATVSAQVLN
jgi:AraC family transcriptional regulator